MINVEALLLLSNVPTGGLFHSSGIPTHKEGMSLQSQSLFVVQSPDIARCLRHFLRVHVDISLKGNANDKGGFRGVRLAKRQEILCDSVVR